MGPPQGNGGTNKHRSSTPLKTDPKLTSDIALALGIKDKDRCFNDLVFKIGPHYSGTPPQQVWRWVEPNDSSA